MAELTRRGAAGEGRATLAELAGLFGTSSDQIQHDIRTLTQVTDEPGEWLSSLAIAQVGDTLSIESRGPFQRPLRLTAVELAAIQIGLAAEPGAATALSGEFAGMLEAAAPLQVAAAPRPGGNEATVVDLARQAIDERRVLALRYAGSADADAADRRIEPHLVAWSHGHYYIVAWCRTAGGWRHFRIDRVLDATFADKARFTWRDDAPLPSGPDDLFRPPEEVDEVCVRFSPGIARWVREEFVDARPAADGAVEVTFRVADPHWLVRTVLRYGADAEVLSPPGYRDLMAGAAGDP